uniref:protein-serine/threonine phosphatase n=1 Tax=Davidia involucrata TaxID=16924 RepID=A0A5B6ZQF6_DAVIN
MGGCISTSSRSSCSSRSNGETISPSCLGIGLCLRKGTRKTFSDHVTTLQHLSSIPNRIFTNGRSRTSCIFTQQGRKGINQDAMIVWEEFMPEDVTFCGVFDGHGPHGHLVARKVRDALPLKLLSFLHSYESKQNGSSTTCCNGNLKSDGGDFEKDGTMEDKVDSLWREAFLKSYKAMDKELRSHPNLDCFCSGSTAVTIVKQGSNLFMGNIGDSRAILGSKDSNDSMVAIQLTVDLKPDLPREAERIKQCKGRVFALQDEPEVPRVWLPFDDAPGLAMARAFGDFCLKEYGVISIPEFSHRILTERDKFIVLASDGVWDVLSNEEVVEIVSSAPIRSSAARILVDSAAREWKSKYPTSKMDDCAVVCLFLDGKMDSESDYDEQGFSSVTLQSNHSGNAVESDDGQNSEPSLQRNFTVRSSEENDPYKRVPVEVEGNGETVFAEDQNWSGLEGVTRVNSLVQLPRFSEERPKP